MKIDVSKMKKIAGKAFPFKVEAEWPPLDLQGETLSFLSPVTLEGTATYTGSIIMVEGTASASIQRLCSRCLEPVQQNLQVPFAEEYAHSPEKAEQKEGEDAEKYINFTGNNIDLAPQVRECLILDLPISSLCREDCLGLCPTCGQNLNTGKCQCTQEKLDPRLQVLEKFLKP